MRKQFKTALIGLFFIAYPVVIYILISSGLPWFGAFIVVGGLLWKFRRQSDKILLLSGLVLGLAVSAYAFGPAFISKAAPFLIHSTLFYVFWSSLKTTPLIARFARLDFPQFPPGIAEYCRKLTIVWCVFFALNIVINIVLALYDEHQVWALYNGLIVYILLGVLVAGEYMFRRIKFPELEFPGFRQSLENMVKNGHIVWGHKDKSVEQAG